MFRLVINMHAKLLLTTLLLISSFTVTVYSQELRQHINAHDPSVIKVDDTYYLYCTGKGIATWSSKDLLNWKSDLPVFSSPPKWTLDAVPGLKNSIWAPDISYSNGQYYLYYAVSSFGKNNSAIGVATNLTLNPKDTAYKWIDHGMLIQSKAGENNWNAIDPNLIVDQSGVPYLAFGSFWSGIKIIRLTPDKLKISGTVQDLTTIASRGNQVNAIEAPFIFRKENYYYLFASVDYCCKGKESTYKMIVGRAKDIAGPYVDDNGQLLTRGGGKLLLQGNENWYGVGHNAVATFGKEDYLVFHGYAADQNGTPKLLIRKLSWKRGWPSSEAL